MLYELDQNVFTVSEPEIHRTYLLTFAHNKKTYKRVRADYVGPGWWQFNNWLLMDGNLGVEIISWEPL
jgi:hypothetical protein